MRDSFRLLFFSLVFTIVLGSIIFLSLSDTFISYFQSSPNEQSSKNSPSDDEGYIKSTAFNNSDYTGSTEDTEPNHIEDDDIEVPSVDRNGETKEEYIKRLNAESEEKWKYGYKIEMAKNLSDYYDNLIRSMSNGGSLNVDDYLGKTFDSKTLKQAFDDSTNKMYTKSEQEKIRSTMNYSFNRDIVENMLELLQSPEKDAKLIAYDYFYNNVFPEIGEVIVSKIVENPNYDEWFKVKTERCGIKSIFQIFTYYASQKTFPMFYFAYKNYVDSESKPEFVGEFNSFFAGITSHVPFNTNIADIDEDYWKNFYEVYYQDIHGLQLKKSGEISVMKPTGDFEKFLTEEIYWKYFATKYNRFPRRDLTNLGGDTSFGLGPSHLTYVPMIIEKLSNALSQESDLKLLQNILAYSDFLTDVSHPVLADIIYQTGVKLIENEKIRKNTCEYFSKVGNIGEFSLKYAQMCLKNKYEIDDQCRNMLIALDEPELIDLLLKYDETNENWATVMVRLTQITFGSLEYDKDVQLWKVYFKTLLQNKKASENK